MQVQEVKFPVKYIVRQRCAEGMNSGVKGLMGGVSQTLWIVDMLKEL
jgi:hypothetical protein